MKLLIVTQYYPPEVGAPQNRLHELAVRLQKEGVEVHVLTAMPNYPKGKIFPDYRDKTTVIEEIDGIKVHRTSIYATRSKSIIKRLRNYFSFVWSSFRYRNQLDGDYDFILCESPPLFLGISAYLIAKQKRAKFIFNVSDLWPESAEKLGLVTNPLFLKMATILEEWLYKKADFITGQTQGIVKNIHSRFPHKEVYWLPNGVDISLFNPGEIETDFREKNGFSPDDLLFLYAGIIGHAQGLEVILKAAKRLKQYPEIKFILLGTGPVKNDLLKIKAEENLDNVFFLDVVPKPEMPKIVKAVDVAIVPLRKLELFKGAIPSKIFENLAMKKPVLLGVEGEAKELFIDEGKAGWFFEPENDAMLAEKIMEIRNNKDLIRQYGENGREYVSEKFNRNMIARDFFNQLTQILKK
ncbi:MAG: glycosyltransferase WbuB [Bacteroidetes bacterium]|nr:MAG: glycosyltransferase WbuB [Bacteroidota bacterium]